MEHLSLPFFLLDKAIDIVLMIVSVALGYFLGVTADARLRANQERLRRHELLRELINSLKQNVQYLDQITNHHIPRGEWPTFHLDTVWLHYFVSTVWLDIPAFSKYRDEFNRLRFELDHINNKIDLVFMMHPGSSGGDLEKPTMDIMKSTFQHIQHVREQLKNEIAALEPLLSSRG